MLTLLVAAFVLALIVGVVGTGGAAVELGKIMFSCAIVLMLISAIVGIFRGSTRA